MSYTTDIIVNKYFIFITDVVYIGTIHPYHYECCKLVLNGGKSVLCEKPMCMNTKQAKEIIDLAKERKFFFMEVSSSYIILHKLIFSSYMRRCVPYKEHTYYFNI